jgi:ribonuclease HI
MIIYTDGCPNKVEFVVDGVSHLVSIPFSTNFEAEYKSIIEALKWMHKNEIAESTTIYNDNAVVIQQIRGMARVKEFRLQVLCKEVADLVDSYFRGIVTFEWVGKRKNLAGKRF